MKNRLFLILMGLLWLGLINAQDESKILSVGLLPVTSIPDYGDRYTEYIRDQISNAFASKSRFAVVERASLDAIYKERNLQMREDFIDGTIVEQGKSIGAQYLISCNISEITSAEINEPTSALRKNSAGQLVMYYFNRQDLQINFNINIKLIDVATGAVQSSKKISRSVRYKGSEHARPAVQNCILPTIESLGVSIRYWVNEIFPVEMKIIQVETSDKKGMPKTVLVTGGAEMDMQNSRAILSNTSSELEVFEARTISVDGREILRPLVIGKVIVEKVEGELAVCKIKSGGELIKAKLDDGKTLFLRIIEY